MKSVSLPRLTAIFLRIGNLTFGGGDPTVAALYAELVTARRWLSVETYALVFALARVTPGTNVLAFGAGAAWEITGWGGAVLAVLAMSVPAALAVVLLTQGYDAWKTNSFARAGIGGTLAAAVGLMASSAWRLLAPQLSMRDWRLALRALAIAGAALAVTVRFDAPPVGVLALAAAAGWVWRAPRQ